MDVSGGINTVRDKYKAAKIAAGGGKGDSATQDIEIAVAKATNHDEAPPKEKHVRTLTYACEPGQENRRNVQLMMNLLTKRANNEHGWLITLKCMMTMHRLMRDTDRIFLQELVQWSANRGQNGAFGLGNYKDVKDPAVWDSCSWIRVYSIYLDETVELYRSTHFDLMGEKDSVANKIRGLSSNKLLDLLPRLQRCQTRLTGCLPEGKASHNGVILDATLLVLRESFRLYHANSEAVVCMVDRFFEMDRVSALKAIDIYKQAIDGTDSMASYFQHTKAYDNINHSVVFPEINAPPYDFLHQMEEYAATAPVDAGAAISPGNGLSKVEATPLPAGSAGQAAAGTAGGDVGDLLKDLDIGGPGPAQANPFSGDAFAPNGSSASPGFSDPFNAPAAAASPGFGPSDPFRNPSSDPFGPPSVGFGAPQAAPGNSFGPAGGFAGPPQNPFAGGNAGGFAGAPQNPFGNTFGQPQPQQQQQQQQNPFGSNPFGGPTDPFSSPAPAAAFPSDPFGSDPFAAAPGGGFPPQQHPMGFGAPAPLPASMMGGPKPPSGNPFINSGIQPDMMTDRVKKSVHDPFAALSAEIGGPGKSPGKPGKQQVPMKAKQGTAQAPGGFGASAFPAPTASNPFGDLGPGF